MRPYFLRKMSLGNRNGITVPVLCAFSYNVPAAPSALAAPSSEQPVALYLHAAYEKCREKPHIIGIYRAVTSSEQIQLKHTQEIQSKGNDDQTGNNVDCRLIFPENTADRSCQRTEGYKYNREAGNKSQCPFQGLAGGSFTASGKVGNIDRQHRKQARGWIVLM